MQKPKNHKHIPYGRQWITREDIQAVTAVLKSDYLTQGLRVHEFEKRIAHYCGARFAVSFSSGTAALHAACFAAGITGGDEVITSPMTFAASANCVLYCGGTPVFADIRSDLPLIDPSAIIKQITQKTKAIIPVDFSGLPADYDEINAIAKKNKLLVIADAAHSLGATYKGRKVGALADMTVFSFHAVKLITTGEGGMVVTDNSELFERLAMFQTHGITKDKTKFVNKSDGNWYHEMLVLGFNYRLTELQAALGLSQLKKVTQFLNRRTEIAEQYSNYFQNIQELSYLKVPGDRTSAWHIFPIQVKKSKRRSLFEKLRKQGIYAQVHYIPVYWHPYYKTKFGNLNKQFPKCELFYSQELSLPLFPHLKDSELRIVIMAIKKILKV